MAGCRLGLVALIKNEADILPDWLASAARWADIAVIIDHGSTDGTADMLRDALRPGWHVWHETNVAYLQELFTAHAIDHAFSLGADWVLPLDADELLQVRNGADLAARLAAVPAGATGALHWVNCIPAHDAGMWWVTPWRSGTTKVAIPRALWTRGDASLPLGNHHLILGGEPARLSYAADLLHFPLRSIEQMRRKIEQGVAALTLRGDDGGPFQQWRWGAAALAAGCNHDLMAAWACRYPAPPLPGFERVSDRDFARWGWRCLPGPRCGVPWRDVA